MLQELHVFNHYSALYDFEPWFRKEFSRDRCRTRADLNPRFLIKNVRFLWFPINFSEFYLPRDNSREEIIKSCFSRHWATQKSDNNIRAHALLGNIAKSRHYFEFVLGIAEHDYSNYERVYYWLEKSSSSYLSLLFLSTFINVPILVIDVSRIGSKEDPVSTFRDVSTQAFDSCWWELRKTATEINNEERARMSIEWEKWCGSRFPIRIMDANGAIVGKNEDFLDDAIKDAVRKETSWRSVLFRVEKGIPYPDFSGMNGWGFISERLKVLCESNAIEGNFLNPLP